MVPNSPAQSTYIALVEGKYYTTDGRDKLIYKPYSLRFRLKSAEKPLSDIVKYLLLDSLKSRYPDADGYVSHHLIYIYNEQDPQQINDIPIQFMGYEQLKAFCAIRRLTYVELSQSIALDVLRTEVETAHLTGQQDYEKVTALRRKITKEADEVISGCELLPDHDSTPTDFDDQNPGYVLTEAPQPQPQPVKSKSKAKPQSQSQSTFEL